ncbi:MAG: type IX secretion system sortase PorU [Bacteroidales bacterium]|jgi:hypothetical protein|nr:type IX secretion system sortase PorU [Bacteroidales bacterium]
MKHYLTIIICLIFCIDVFGQSLNYTDTSVLASGSWYAITVPQSGIYRLGREDFKKLGVPDDSINFDNLTIWGQGGFRIPNSAVDYYGSDLTENAIYVNTQGNPYALFYSDGNTRWIYNKGTNNYDFEINPYTDVTTYFVCFDPDKGQKKRIEIEDMPSGNSDYNVDFVREVFLHNRDLVNPAGQGESFYGESLSHLADTLKIPINLIDFVPSSIARVKFAAGSTRTGETNVLTCKFNNAIVASFNIVQVDPEDPSFESQNAAGATQPLSRTNDTAVIIYKPGSTRDKANLDYILVNYDKYLRFRNMPLVFNAVKGITENKIAEYHITNVNQSIKVWNVSNQTDVKEIQPSFSLDTAILKLNTNSLQRIIVFSGANFPSPSLKGKVENQNLHSSQPADFVIITAPEFVNQADNLAELHRIYDSINVMVVLTTQIYNEFSSGNKDYFAFREYLRMLYKRYSPLGIQPKNVLLFGDGTYDNKNILKYNNNFIPVNENDSAADVSISLLDESDTLKACIGVGRFTVNDTNEANLIVDKCRRYLLKEDLRESNNYIINDWKNYSVLTCDDNDKGETGFVSTAEAAYDSLVSGFPMMNAYKVYSDGYTQHSSSGGSTYPDATKAINNRMKKGALTFNYVGHGSEDHLSSERLVTIADITSWTNYNQLTLFITSTCEFTKYDMVDKSSGGEHAFLSPNGCAIALVSSPRRIASLPEVNARFHKIFVEKQADGKPLTFGEAFAKCYNSGRMSTDFVLIGDPALRLNIPMFNVHTKTINGFNVEDTLTATKDTIRALSQMSITGDIRDYAGNVITNFNGKVVITLFDKVKKSNLLDNEGRGNPAQFEQQNNIIYKGTTDVINGEFTHTFTIPKDIARNYGQGKLSYYAKTDSIDASGYTHCFIVGGIDPNASIDTTYPTIRLYMNDTNFRTEGITDENPDLFAIIQDSIAINTVGSGLGHDIIARLDNAANTFVLNDYYEVDAENPNKGYIRFPFTNLQDGKHTLSLKVWNIFNFSSEKTITFYVNNGIEPVYTKLINYPNPFTEYTTINIEHNQPNKITEATIYIFDISGRVVRRLPATPYISAYTIGPLQWDGTNEGGSRLKDGYYVYKAVLQTSDGEVHSAGQKMIIFNRNK